MSLHAPDRPSPAPPSAPGAIPGVAASLLGELQRWCEQFERGALAPAGEPGSRLATGERFAVHVGGVRAAGLGHPARGGTLTVTDRRVLLHDPEAGAEPLREWELTELAAVSALGNWGGVMVVHPGGDAELLVAAGPERPGFGDAAGWLKVEAAFAAAAGRLQPWLAQLRARLAGGDEG